MSIEERRIQGEKEWQIKFENCGLSESFILLGRDWNTDHGRKVKLKCRKCGAEFSSWALLEIFKGRQNRLICLECGCGSDGADVWPRSAECDEAMEYYVDGHTVKETAERFGVSTSQINNTVKKRKLTNGRDWKQSGIEINERRHAEAAKLFEERRAKGELKYLSIKDNHKRRAVQFGCEYDASITLRKLIERDGLRCALCGELCDLTDHRWTKFTGPLYPSIDHIIPMSKGGGHTWDNVQVAHLICNSIKGARDE